MNCKRLNFKFLERRLLDGDSIRYKVTIKISAINSQQLNVSALFSKPLTAQNSDGFRFGFYVIIGTEKMITGLFRNFDNPNFI